MAYEVSDKIKKVYKAHDKKQAMAKKMQVKKGEMHYGEHKSGKYSKISIPHIHDYKGFNK